MSDPPRALVSAEPDAEHTIEEAEAEAGALLAVLADELPAGAELSVHLVRDDRMRELNRTWREQDRPTDVLSFPLDDDEPAGAPLLGDVIVNLDAVARQAPEHHLEPREELRFLLLHGVLHLLGHDHHDEGERRAMEAREQQLWEALGGTGRIR